MSGKIELGRMFVDDETREAVLRVLESGRYIKGPEAEAFEREFAAFCGARHGVAVSNGTTALHLAYLALGIGPGDEVIVPSHTFIATATPLVHLGARPVFADVDPRTMTLDVEDVKRRVTPRTRAITAVHLYGHPVDMDPLMEVARAHGLKVVEDTAQAHDAEYRGRRLGSIGDVATFSFFPSKNMTVAGDGGMVVTNDAALAHAIAMLRDQGREPDKKYEHDLVGFNFRLSEMLAAVGRVQLKRLPEWTRKRREIAAWYRGDLQGSGVRAPVEAAGAKAVYHQFVARVPAEKRDGLMEHLKRQGIATGIHYPIPVHRQPALAKLWAPEPLPVTDALVREIVSLPVHPFLSREDVARAAAEARKFVG